MSLRAMILLQAPVGLRENAVAIFRELLADDDVERELLELADPGDPTLAEGQQPGGRQEGVHGRAQEVGRGAAALGSDLDEAIIFAPVEADRAVRSEEHTSELQSLMRISYAVFCLKKKNTESDHK